MLPLEFDHDRLKCSSRSWRNPSKQIERHLLGSVLQVLPTTPLYPAVTFILSIMMMMVTTMKATMPRLQTIHFQIHGMFEPAIVRGALKENKFSFLHLLLMWPGHLMQHLSRVTFSSFFDNLHYFYSLFESSAFKTKLQFWHVCHDQLTWALATRWDRGARSILLLSRFSGL